MVQTSILMISLSITDTWNPKWFTDLQVNAQPLSLSENNQFKHSPAIFRFSGNQVSEESRYKIWIFGFDWNLCCRPSRVPDPYCRKPHPCHRNEALSMRRGGGAKEVVELKSISEWFLNLTSIWDWDYRLLIQWHQKTYDFMLLDTFVKINSLLDCIDYEYKDSFPCTRMGVHTVF